MEVDAAPVEPKEGPHTETRTYVEVITLLGDSILDNKSYVRAKPSVITTLRRKIAHHRLPWESYLRAVDGDIIKGIKRQMRSVPKETTCLVLSVGGNDGLQFVAGPLADTKNPISMINSCWTFLREFSNRYNEMLSAVHKDHERVVLCTIYKPQWDGWLNTFASLFIPMGNRIIKSAAKEHGFPVIDVCALFDSPDDYANPIEPGVKGGDKITHNIIKIVKEHEWGKHKVYAENGTHQEEYEVAVPREKAMEEEDRKECRKAWTAEEVPRDTAENEEFRH